MGLKLELLLVVLIAFTSMMTVTTTLKNQKIDHSKAGKELEFTNTTFTEVTTQKIEGIAFGVHGVRKRGILYVDKLRYHNNDIKLLLADKGRFEVKRLYLDGNVSLHQSEGTDYYTEHAYYDKITEILHVTAPFVGYYGKNILRGTSMRYDTRKKHLFAREANATLYTDKK